MDFWNENTKFQNKFLDEMIKVRDSICPEFSKLYLKDCLYEPISGICSGYLVSAKASVKKDRKLLAWIQEEIIGKF